MDPAGSPLDAATWLDELRSVIDHDADAAMHRLDAAALPAAVASEPAVAVAVLRAVSALAWRTPRAASVFTRLDRFAGTRQVARWRERAQLDLMAGAAYREAHRPILPPFVFDLLADAALESPARRRATAGALVNELRADPMHYLESFEVLDGRCFDLSEALTVRFLDDVALDRRELDVLPRPLALELSQRLTLLGGRMATLLVTLAGVGALAAGTGVAILVEPSLGMMAAGGGLFGAGGLRGQAYRRSVRRELARIVADLGVTRACLREAMRRRGGRLSGFANPAGNDRALRLCGMLAAAAHSVAADDAGAVPP